MRSSPPRALSGSVLAIVADSLLWLPDAVAGSVLALHSSSDGADKFGLSLSV